MVTESFPPGSFDLIHARWVLVNLPQREEVLAKAVTWLAPGGWLVLEDLDTFPVDSSPHPALRRFSDAFEKFLADSHGADYRWAWRRPPAALAEAGLLSKPTMPQVWPHSTIPRSSTRCPRTSPHRSPPTVMSRAYCGIRRVWPAMIRSGSVRVSRFAS